MAGIISAGIHSEWVGSLSGRRIPRYFALILAMIMSFAVGNVGTILLARAKPTVLPSNVFARYADLLGQGRQAAVGLGFTCRMGTYPTLPGNYCTRTLRAGPFSRVGLVISDGAVSRIDLALRGDGFKIGDAILLWGKPEVRSHGHVVDLFWTGRSVSASGFSPNRRFSHFLPLWSISITQDAAG